MAPNFLKDFAPVSIQTEEQELKFDSTKLFITAFLSSDPKKIFRPHECIKLIRSRFGNSIKM